jgi:hypothetical protein
VRRDDSIRARRRLDNVGEYGRTASNGESPRYFTAIDRVGYDNRKWGVSIDGSVKRGHRRRDEGRRNVGAFGEDNLLCTERTQIGNEAFACSRCDNDNRNRSADGRGSGEG